MKYVFGAIAFIVSFLGAVGATGGGAGGGSFDFDAATLEEREAWMERQARAIANGVRHGLPNGSGMAPRMEVDEVLTHPSKREIEIVVQIKEQAQIVSNSRLLKRELHSKTCGQFVKLPVYRQDVRVVQTIKYLHGGVAMRARMSAASCDRELARQERVS